MAKAIALYTGGINFLVERAVREDGVVFQRLQDKHPRFGYRWGPWKTTGEVYGENMRANPPASVVCGFATLFLRDGMNLNEERAKRLRLPA